MTNLQLTRFQRLRTEIDASPNFGMRSIEMSDLLRREGSARLGWRVRRRIERLLREVGLAWIDGGSLPADGRCPAVLFSVDSPVGRDLQGALERRKLLMRQHQLTKRVEDLEGQLTESQTNPVGAAAS